MKSRRTSATSTTKKHPLKSVHRRLPAAVQKRLNVRQFTLCLIGVVIILAGTTWFITRDQADTQKSATNNAATSKDDEEDHSDDKDDGQPKRGKLTLAPTSVTLSKSDPESTSVAITAPVAVGKPAVTPTHYSPINLVTQDDAAPPRNSHTIQVTLNPNQPPLGTYYVPIQAVHDGPGLRYYYVNLAVHVVK